MSISFFRAPVKSKGFLSMPTVYPTQDERETTPDLVFYPPSLYDAGREVYARNGWQWPEHYRRQERIPIDPDAQTYTKATP
jgi:hypothetical protein